MWERSFAYEPGAGPGAPTQSVLVRDAPWERVAAALAAEGAAIASSDVHRNDWSPERAREVELGLLDALQLPIQEAQVELIGRSHFTTTDTPDPAGPELSKFASSIGAEYAVWSRQWLGKAETIEREPIERERWRWDRVWDADRKHYVYVRRWETETDWVPVVIERDESRYVVFYVRRADQGT